MKNYMTKRSPLSSTVIATGPLSTCRLVEYYGQLLIHKTVHLEAIPIYVPKSFFSKWLIRREIKALELLNDLSRIPHYVHPDTAQSYYRTFVQGNPAPMDWVPTVAQARALGRLVESIHKRGVALLDIGSPKNIILEDDNSVSLVDLQTAVFQHSFWGSLLFALCIKEDRYHVSKYIAISENRLDTIPPRTFANKCYRVLHRLVCSLESISPFKKIRTSFKAVYMRR